MSQATEEIKTEEMERRDFLKKAVLGAVGVAAVAASLPGKALGAGRKQYGMVIDLRRCTGCRACMVACKAENNVSLGGFRNWVNYAETGAYPSVRLAIAPRLCNHCTEPECLKACPVKAIYKREDGIVLVDENKCKNIKQCITRCPYGAIHTDPVSLKANKCTLCLHRVEAGVVPSCVNTCQGRARIFGDLNDPTSETARLVAIQPTTTTTLRPHIGEPNIYYIGLDEASATGKDDEWMRMNREFSSARR